VVIAAAFSALVGYAIAALDGGRGAKAPAIAMAIPPAPTVTTVANSGNTGVTNCSVPDGSTLRPLSLSSLTSSAAQVGGGEIEGTTWTLWSEPSSTGTIESGGIIINGQAYALCLESTIPSSEQIDVDGAVITYHVIGNASWPTVQVTIGPLSGYSAEVTAHNLPGGAAINRASMCLTTPDSSACAFSNYR
jgi:hypothetical protein